MQVIGCPRCGYQAQVGTPACPHCGQPFHAQGPPASYGHPQVPQYGYGQPPQQGYPQPPQQGYPQPPQQGYAPQAPYAQTPVAPQAYTPHSGMGPQSHAGAPQQSDSGSPEQTVAGLEHRILSLRQELQSVEEAKELQSFGFYHPRYGFDTSDQYTKKLEKIRARQKALMKEPCVGFDAGDERATHCLNLRALDGSLAKGKKALKQYAKLMLRAFNGEADAAIAKVKYDNVVNLEKRLKKTSEAINALGKQLDVYITGAYYDAKIAELYLVHEHREKVQEEKEEQKRIRDELREQEKAEKEIAKAKKDAEEEEARNTNALEKARKELADSTGKQHDKLEALVNKLEAELAEAIDRKAKAIARAQLTKSGHVYVLSNVGSFGDKIFKIGMTRRFEPQERVDELGDASVPFRFDVHAMIYTEDVPGLENALHKEFADRRVNKVNLRREYFRVTLDEVRQAVAKYHGEVTFVTAPKAEEYMKTQAFEREASE